MSERTDKLSCTTTACEEDAVIYCSVCKLLFCQSHHEAHEGFVKLLPTPHEVMSSEDYMHYAETEEKGYCTQHTKSPIVLACEKCYHPMCLKCLDYTDAEATRCPDQGKHQTKQIEHVAAKVQEEVRDLLKKLRARELVNADDLKERQKIFDKQTEENRLDLDKLAAKISELHKMIDELADQTRDTLVKHMNEKKDLMQKWETEFTDYQQACSRAHDKTSRIMKMNDAIIVNDQGRIKESLSPLIGFKINYNQPAMTNMSLVIKDETVNLPVSLRETRLIPTSIVYKEGRNTPSGKSVYAVQYVNGGLLLDAGHQYQVNGLNYTPQIPSGSDRYNCSLFEHKSSLYVLQCHNNDMYIHVLNLLTQSVQQSVISYPGGGIYPQITVNDDYMIITDYDSKSAKVYSTKTHGHQFDIKHECISRYPRGVAFLKNTIVVGDYSGHQVSNITISASPELRWTCEGIKDPTAIRVIEESRMILVALQQQKQICILSYEGEKLTTLDVPQCGGIYGMATYGNQLAIADQSAQVKIYNIKTDTD